MRSRLSRYLKHLTLPVVLVGATGGALAGTPGPLAAATGLSIGASTACGCGMWVIEASPTKLKSKEKTKFTVKNETGALGEVNHFNFGGTGSGFKEVPLKEFKLCEGGYVDGGSCEFEFEYTGTEQSTFWAELVDGHKVGYRSVTISGGP